MIDDLAPDVDAYADPGSVKTRMIRKLNYTLVTILVEANARGRHGWQYASPVRPDRILWIDPHEVVHKPENKPESNVLRKPLIVGGSWDRELTRIEDDIVYEALFDRFVDGASWEATGYIEFLSTDVSEHGNVSRDEAKRRCEKLDRLYEYIKNNGYRTQAELERDGELLEEFSISVLPPRFREVSVDITRDGEFVWNGGMHRLVIAQLLDIDELPVRVNVRHQLWQAIREAAYNGKELPRFRGHEDVRYLI